MATSTCSWLSVKPRAASSIGPRTVSMVGMACILAAPVAMYDVRGARYEFRDGRRGVVARPARCRARASRWLVFVELVREVDQAQAGAVLKEGAQAKDIAVVQDTLPPVPLDECR